MNQLKKIIHYNQLISKNLNKNQFILSKDKKSPLSFIEITPNQYRFVFDDYDKHMKLNNSMKNLLFVINEESRNWEGVVRFDNKGFIVVVDEYPRTILAFVKNKLK